MHGIETSKKSPHTCAANDVDGHSNLFQALHHPNVGRTLGPTTTEHLDTRGWQKRRMEMGTEKGRGMEWVQETGTGLGMGPGDQSLCVAIPDHRSREGTHQPNGRARNPPRNAAEVTAPEHTPRGRV